ncbi:MAG: endonuclease III, partial [Bacilli bacterium]|nr:endonuclease III [Bacilli bacterium]
MLYLDKLIPNPACELNYTKDYELLIAVMLSAQTTDKRVNMVTKILFDKYPTLESLDKAELEDIINIIRSIGNYNKKALNIKLIANDLLIKSNGKVPNNREFLESLSGVGRKTTNVVLSNLFNEPCIAVDTHVARVSIRLGLAKPKDNVLVIEKKITKLVPVDRRLRIHHQLVLFGRYYCKAKKPLCKDCG